MNYQNLLVNTENGICTIYINRPKAYNALNYETLLELREAIQFAETDSEVKAVIFTGSGEKAFIAGADLSYLRDIDPLTARNFVLIGQKIFSSIEKMEKPVIAAINGFALGGGCELAMCCDIRIASENAKFSQPEVNLGIIPGWGGTQRLPRLIGKSAAKYYIFTGEQFNAQEALSMGLVSKVVPLEQLMSEALRIANSIISKAPIAVKIAKQCIDTGLEAGLAAGCLLEIESYVTCIGTEDRVEGVTAFLEKRAPVFKNK